MQSDGQVLYGACLRIEVGIEMRKWMVNQRDVDDGWRWRERLRLMTYYGMSGIHRRYVRSQTCVCVVVRF